MTSRGRVELKLEDIFAVLQNTSLPTVLVEGKDDVIVLRRLEEIYTAKSVSVLPAGGRSNVLEVYSRRSTLNIKAPVVYVVDRDFWVVTAVPTQYQTPDIILTNGYSIENDIIRDGNLEALLSSGEKVKWLQERADYLSWYTVQLDRILSGKPTSIKTYPGTILDDPNAIQSAKQTIAADPSLVALEASLSLDPNRLIRGKSLIHVLMRQLSYPRRAVHHRHDALFEITAANPGALISDLFAKVGNAIP